MALAMLFCYHGNCAAIVSANVKLINDSQCALGWRRADASWK